MPVGQSDLLGEQAADLHGILGWQQELCAALYLSTHRIDDRLGRIAHGHAQVGDVEVQIAVAIHIGELGAARVIDKGRAKTIQRNHPGHRHTLRHVCTTLLA